MQQRTDALSSIAAYFVQPTQTLRTFWDLLDKQHQDEVIGGFIRLGNTKALDAMRVILPNAQFNFTIDTKSGIYVPIGYAAEIGNAEVVSYMLGAGANPNLVPYEAEESQFQRLSPENSQLARPVLSALAMGHIAVARILLEAGAQLEPQSVAFRIAITRAANTSFDSFVVLVASASIDTLLEIAPENAGTALFLSGVVRTRGRPLNYQSAWLFPEVNVIVKTMENLGITAGTPVGASEWTTPLLIAISRKNISAFKIMLEKFPDSLEAADYAGVTPLFQTVLYNKLDPDDQVTLEIARELIGRGAKSDVVSDKYGVLMKEASPAFVKILRQT